MSAEHSIESRVKSQIAFYVHHHFPDDGHTGEALYGIAGKILKILKAFEKGKKLPERWTRVAAGLR